MAKDKSTSPRVARDASQTLRDPNASRRSKELAGSDLSQAKLKPKSGKKK